MCIYVHHVVTYCSPRARLNPCWTLIHLLLLPCNHILMLSSASFLSLTSSSASPNPKISHVNLIQDIHIQITRYYSRFQRSFHTNDKVLNPKPTLFFPQCQHRYGALNPDVHVCHNLHSLLRGLKWQEGDFQGKRACSSQKGALICLVKREMVGCLKGLVMCVAKIQVESLQT